MLPRQSHPSEAQLCLSSQIKQRYCSMALKSVAGPAFLLCRIPFGSCVSLSVNNVLCTPALLQVAGFMAETIQVSQVWAVKACILCSWLCGAHYLAQRFVRATFA
eukprot:296041-Pelagomonas_calceolata.AAC.1